MPRGQSFIDLALSFAGRVAQSILHALGGISTPVLVPPTLTPFSLDDPSTFAVSTGTFKGSYYYTISVSPSDPSTYKGPPFYTVTTSSLMSEGALLVRAQEIADSTYRYANKGQVFQFQVVGATVKAGLL